MQFRPCDHARYRHCGGDILDRRCPLDLDEARRLHRFFAEQVTYCLVRGDRSGASYCARTAKDLDAALCAAAAWARASGRYSKSWT